MKVIITDKECNILVVNNSFTDITGITEEEMIGKNPDILFSDRHPEEFYSAMWDHLNKEGNWHGEIWNIKKNGDDYLTWTRITSVTDDMNNIINYVLVFSDITKIKQSEEHLKFLAHHDALTLLPNRTSLSLELEQAIHRAERQEQQFAIYFIDLDQFKHINDSLGHDIGDRILVKTSERLKQIARNEDTVSRLGGDEFVFIAETIKTIHDSSTVAERIIAIFNTSFEIEDLQLYVTPSIGIALYPDNGITPDELLKNADAAMYRAKLDGRNNFSYYSEELTIKAAERVKYENMLRHALENGELSLYYQPQIDIVQKKIQGIEVLLRWEHPTEGLISPDTFIPIAEDSGQICAIGQWVLQKSCQFMKQLISDGVELNHISVNVSGIQFLRGQFVEYVEQLLKDIGLEGRYLQLEITESIVMNDKIKSIEALNKLAKIGISLSIDDFGTGYSSLSYLKKLPINCIKIDQSFIHDIPDDKDDKAITRSIIALGNALNLDIIAEGVEQIEQLEFLRKEGCNLIQGFFISQPIKDEEMITLLKQPENFLNKFETSVEG